MTQHSYPLQSQAVEALRRHIRGELLLPGDARYAVGRRGWNASIDRMPAGIVRCADAEDVTRALRIATEHGLPVTVRAGGHNVAGGAVADGALLIDLSRMRAVSVHAESEVAEVQGGALWHDVDVAAARCGLGDDRRDGLEYRGGRIHPWRRSRLADAQVRAGYRQPAGRLGRTRRWPCLVVGRAYLARRRANAPESRLRSDNRQSSLAAAIGSGAASTSTATIPRPSRSRHSTSGLRTNQAGA